jgi:hypothetical protein
MNRPESPMPRIRLVSHAPLLGLWGGILEGTNLRVSADAATGHAVGSLEW